MQRQSECFRKGKSDQEIRIDLAFCKWTIPLTDNIICFECGGQFYNMNPSKYPSGCKVCGKKYNDVGMYCMPDVILDAYDGKNKMVVYVNGPIHDRKADKARDRYQHTRLKQLGYKVWVIKNEEIDNLRNSNLMALTKTLLMAVTDDALFTKMLKDEKEF